MDKLVFGIESCARCIVKGGSVTFLRNFISPAGYGFVVAYFYKHYCPAAC